MKRMTILAAVLLAVFAIASCSGGPQKATPNKDRAEEMFDLVWKLYRVDKYGLFSEYYPNSYRPDLTYFNDSTRKAQEVSFLWPMSGIYSSAVIMAAIDPEYLPYVDSMAVSMEKYFDTSRLPFGYQAYPVQFGKVDRYYDDNGLVGIDYIDSYRVTKNPVYLERAKHVLTFILSGWDDRFEGGVPWVEGSLDQKPACANGKAMVLALKLYEATGDTYYLETGRKFYEWFDKYLKDPERGVVYNSWLTAGEGSIHPDLYTYNTGTLLQAAVFLYRFTGEQAYLDNANFLAEGSMKEFFRYTEDGIPYGHDLPWFRLVLFRGYHELYNVTGDPKYVDVVIKALDYAWDNARDVSGLYYHDWTGRTDESRQPKWLLDASCIPEYYARVAMIRGEVPDRE